MQINFFKKIRESYITGTLLASLMSNVIVFGQPIQQISNKVNQIAVIKNNNITYLDNLYSSVENNLEPNNDVKKIVSNRTNSKKIRNIKKVFEAVETLAVVGEIETKGNENPRDNFFTINISNEINLLDYKAVLKYDLYGLSSSIHTTKSINNSSVYGGKAIKVNKEWSSVQELLPGQLIKNGKNEIFFNRRKDITYHYKIKNLRIELLNKGEEDILISDSNLINYNGTLHILGHVNNKVNKIKIMGKTITVEEGIYEHIINDLPEKTKKIEVLYFKNDVFIGKKDFKVNFSNENLDQSFLEESNNSDYKISDKHIQLESIVIEDNLNQNVPNSMKIIGLDFKNFKPLNTDIQNVTSGAYYGYRIESKREKDSLDLKIHLKYDESKIPDGYGVKDVRTFLFDKNKREWVVLPVDSLDFQNKTLISKFRGDTDYINGVIKVPEMAETSSFTPTTITDMKYADPTSGIVSIAPPSPNSMGSASTSFPIKLPPGRNGMAPSLSVNYNSGSGNSWMGVGWDLQLPAITIDTKWGVPRFDGTNESEIYQLNGETLVQKVGNEYTNPHRYNGDISRNTSGTKTFYLKREGSYMQIIRLGNSPSSYYWLVIDKYGNKNFYGDSPNHRIEDESGNKTHWAISKTIDPFGNKIQYNYSKGNVSLSNLSTQFFYPLKIRYTTKDGLSLSNQNYYEIDFTRNNYSVGESGSVSREDVTTNSRTGTLMTINDLLTEVKVSYNKSGVSNTIRTYRFDYQEKAFKKNQLVKISEYDTNGDLFYSNSMDYYSVDIYGSGEYSIINNNSSSSWSGNSDSFGSTLSDIAPSGLSLLNGSALGTSTTSGDSRGMRLGFGLGKNIWSVSNTAGYSNSFSKSKEKTRISFLDINGDGLPDKVYTSDNGNVKYLPNLGLNLDTSEGSFGSARNIESGISNLDQTKSRTSTSGVDINLFGIIGAGTSWSTTRTDTDNYFTDFNGDGLPDLVSGGLVKFNETPFWNSTLLSDVSFGINSANTSNSINSGSINDDIVQNLELLNKSQLRSEFPQFDHVKVWKVPYTGTISITGTADLISFNDCGQGSNTFRLTIEKAEEGDTTPNGYSLIKYLDSSTQSDQMNKTLSVVKDELIFFRSHNEEYGCGGEIKWNPSITYTSVNSIPNGNNEHNKNYKNFDSEADLMINNGKSWTPSDDSVISIAHNLSLTQNQFSDDLKFIIEKTTYTHSISGSNYGQIIDTETHIWEKTYEANNGNLSTNSAPSNFLNVSNQLGGSNPSDDKTYSFRFYIESDSNVQWNQINWQPTISQNGNTFYPTVDYLTFDDNVNQTNYEIDANNTFPDPNINGDGINPMIRVSHNTFDGLDYSIFDGLPDDIFPINISWLVKEKIDNNPTETIYKIKFLVNRFLVTPSFSSPFYVYYFETESGQSINQMDYPEYYFYDFTKSHVENLTQASSSKIYSSFYIDNKEFAINNPSNISIALHPNEQYNYSYVQQDILKPFMAKKPMFYGWSYRGWGQFLYNSSLKYQKDNEGEYVYNSGEPIVLDVYDGPINMTVFNTDLDMGQQNQLEDDINNLNISGYDSNNVDVRYALYSQDNQNNLFNNISILNSLDTPVKYGYNATNLTHTLGRFGDYNIYDYWTDPATLTSGTVFVGLKQRSKSKGNATSGTLGFGTGTESNGSSRILNQYLDVNGDRYPDIVTDGNIQFTSMKGALLPDSSSSNKDIIGNSFVVGGKSKDRTVGVTISGLSPNSTDKQNNNESNSTVTNISSGLNYSDGESYNSRMWNDINGDGLVDKIIINETDVRVRLNTGYGFSDEIIWGSGYFNLYTSERSNVSVSAGGSVAVTTASFGAGFGATKSTAKLNASLIDVNGDGLPDLVIKTSGDVYKFYLNKGTGFESGTTATFYTNHINKDVSLAGNIYGTWTNGIPIPLVFITLKITFTPTVSFNAGINEKQITIQDINGDGLPDVLHDGDDNGDVVANLNTVGRANLLRIVQTPLGGNWTVDYKREGNTYDMPSSQWVLSEVFTNDGFIADSNNDFSLDDTGTSIEYYNGKYDRREREFLGFGQVKVNQLDLSVNDYPTYRYSLTEYHNENVYLKGLVKSNAMFDANDNILSESTTLYNIMDPESPSTNVLLDEDDLYLQSSLSASLLDHSRLFVAPVKSTSTMFENGQELTTEQQFLDYDIHGNLLTYKNLGDTYASSSDAYRTEMEYSDGILGVPASQNGYGFVEKISVYKDDNNQLLRQRVAEYDTGKLTKVITKLNATENNIVQLSYDDYGNVEQTTSNSNFITNITYDSDLHMYPTTITNSFGHISSSEYNYLFGVPVLVTDTNNQQLRTRIDDRGRIVEVTAPMEISETNGWTIRMEYEGDMTTPPAFVADNYMVDASGSFSYDFNGITILDAKHHAVTRHFVPDAQNNQLLTVSLVDGLGQPIQVKKTLFANGQLKWQVSGREKTDAFGRVVRSYFPTVQGYSTDTSSSSSMFDFISTANGLPQKLTSYDVRDRVISVTQPGESNSATTTFDILDGMFVTTVTNELNQTFATYTDVRGRQRKTVQNDELTTEFYYNIVGEKTKVKNHQGYETFYTYDLAGRRLEEKHPDRGLTQFTYDTSGNLTEKLTSNLKTNSQQPIIYNYDIGNRLTSITYPNNTENNVTYTYGAAGVTEVEENNAIGRLFMQEDASGVQGFGYDELGNINKQLRSVAVAGRHSFWYLTRWEYDSQNRIQQIIYPDKEEVNYNYNLGGTLSNISRSIVSDPVVPLSPFIVSNIEYNDLGERTEITYGNGTSTNYTYDNRRRLKDLQHVFSGSNIKNTYTYDELSNITNLTTVDPSSSIPTVAGQLGGPVSHTYHYDNYNRLISANGRYTGPNDTSASLLAQEYTLNMSYDLAHNITSKTQTHVQGVVEGHSDPITTPETMVKTNYHLKYQDYASAAYTVAAQGGEFGYVQPHAPRTIIETPDQTTNTSSPTYKKQEIEYDANGNQLEIKQILFEGSQPNAYEGVIETQVMTLQKNLWDEEDRLRAVDLNPDNTNPHPIAIYTYDAGGQRVVRYVPGRLDVRSNAYNASINERDEVILYPSPLVTVKALTKYGIMPQSNDLVSNYTKHYYIGAERVSSTLGTARDLGLFPDKLELDFPQIRSLSDPIVGAATTAVNNTYATFGLNISIQNYVSPGTREGTTDRFLHDPDKYDAYWYHSDHLGSSSYISNRFGDVSQHMEYLPYGETLVDEHLNSYNTPFKFNGKELDDETGNYYYGARYYNPKTSIWLSVDPLAEKMPEWSSYNYTFNNPIRYTDPTGMAPEMPLDIIFQNKNGEELARIVTSGEDKVYKIDTDMTTIEPLTINPSDYIDDNNLPDAVGLTLEGAGVLGGGLTYGFDLVYFTDGEDEGNLYVYGFFGGAVGLDGEVGLSGTVYYFNDEANSDKKNAEGLAGQYSGYSAGYGFSGEYQWSNEDNVYELYPGQKSTTTWWSMSVGGGSFSAEVGFKIFWGKSKILGKI